MGGRVSRALESQREFWGQQSLEGAVRRRAVTVLGMDRTLGPWGRWGPVTRRLRDMLQDLGVLGAWTWVYR